MPLPDKNFIDSLSADNLPLLAEADSNGFLMAPGEDISDYKQRLLDMGNAYGEIEKDIQGTKDYNIFGEFVLNTEKRINTEILDEAAALTRKYYDFSINWVPGFFLSKSLVHRLQKEARTNKQPNKFSLSFSTYMHFNVRVQSNRFDV